MVLCAVMPAVSVQGAESYIVADLHSKKILVAKEATEKRQVASLTKIATAMVVLDWMDLTGVQAGTWIRVPETVAGMGGANPLGMYVGDEITIRDALYSAIIGSDNVAAQTLAYFVGYELARQTGTAGSPVDLFVAQMNALASKNGCTNTKFTNPHGLDHEKPVPYSTAADIARIAMYAMSKASFTYYCSQKERKIGFRRDGQLQQFLMKNTNQLLGQSNIDGVKTGMTTKAGQCLVTSAARPNTVVDLADGRKQVIPHRLIVVVLGSPSRFEQSLQLLEAGWSQYDGWEAAGRPVQSSGELLLTLP
jgi:D-alanyl-D-alanine carboxypeptidase